MTSSDLEVIESFLDAMLHDHPIVPLETPGELARIQDLSLKLSNMLQELKQFAVRLAAGDVDATPPPRSNYIAAGLKQLQAQMLHLTWQAQRIAEGDYRQQVDFMGDFSTAFNTMTKQLQTRDANLREQQEVMEKIFNLIESILVVDERSPRHILYANEMAMQRFGVRIGENATLSRTLSEIIGMAPGNTEQQIQDVDSGKWYGVTVRNLHWSDYHEAKLCYCRDITLHKERESNLDIVANTDELTGINNRRAFDNAYATIWSTCLKARKPLSMIMFDLDYFKRFNDTYGHLEGDKMLTAFADILSRCIGRAEDLIARYGGEEFIAALPFTSRENAVKVANAVCRMTAQREFLVRDAKGNDERINISVSGGVSTIVPTESLAPAHLIQAADFALYQSKMTGRNRVSYMAMEDLPESQPSPGE